MKKILRISWLAWKNGALPTFCKDIILVGFILFGVIITESTFGLLIRIIIEISLD
jgi:hypothetical protein